MTKQNIFGEYRIDTTFYPGINSKWQYEHFKFTITQKDSLTFYLTSKDTILKTYTYRLKYSSGPPDLWSIVNDTIYKLLKHPPTLYRGHNKFYYVIHSDNYGNMFFRKKIVDNTCGIQKAQQATMHCQKLGRDIGTSAAVRYQLWFRQDVFNLAFVLNLYFIFSIWL